MGSDAPESKVKGAKVTEGREEHEVKRAVAGNKEWESLKGEDLRE